MSDPVDKASHQVELAERIILNLHANRKRENPVYNTNGAKICLDCEQTIPSARALIEDVVRCIDCQEQLEKRK